MAHFPQCHSSQRARRYRVSESIPVLFLYGESLRMRGRLYEISCTGGSAEMDVPLPASTLVHLSVHASSGLIEAIAEMLPNVTVSRQPFRFIALDERDRDNLHRFLSE